MRQERAHLYVGLTWATLCVYYRQVRRIGISLPARLGRRRTDGDAEQLLLDGIMQILRQLSPRIRSRLLAHLAQYFFPCRWCATLLVEQSQLVEERRKWPVAPDEIGISYSSMCQLGHSLYRVGDPAYKITRQRHSRQSGDQNSRPSRQGHQQM
jgi:hypothetical protein